MKLVKAVILAAGRGKRLSPLSQSTPKPLLRFRSEQSILEYSLLSMGKAGIFEKAVIVTGYMHSAIRNMIKGLSPRLNFEIQDVVNPQYASKSVLYSVEAGLHAVGDGDILLINGDTLFSIAVFDKIKQTLLMGDVPKGAVIGSMKSVLDSDDIQVQLDNLGRIVHIGKNLEQAVAVSCGINLISSSLRAHYVAKLAELKPLDKVIHHHIIEALCRERVPIGFISVALHDWLEVDNMEDLHVAKERFRGDIVYWNRTNTENGNQWREYSNESDN